MTVFVDAAVHPWRGTLWCHLYSHDLAELHDFAARLGLKREWFQEPPAAKWPHYDTIARRRLQAIRMGAVPASRADVVAFRKAWRLERSAQGTPSGA